MTINQKEISADHQTLRLRASLLSMSVAFILVVIKLYAYIQTDSMSVLSALIDSSVDLMASILIFIGIRKAIQPADHSHRYGHYKIESLTALLQAAFIAGSCVILLYEVMNHIIHPQAVVNMNVGLWVMSASILLTMILLSYQYYVIRKTNSVAITADQLHYKGDLFMNFSVIIVLFLSQKISWPYLDPVFAVIIVIFLLSGTRKIIASALDILMDKELPTEERAEIMTYIDKHPEAKGIHDLRSRYDGVCRFIEFHLELAPDLTLHQAHEITDQIENELKEKFAPAEILIHQEPAGLVDERLDDQLKK